MGTCPLPRPPGIQGYAEQAQALISQYESLRFERVHEAELHLLPNTPSRILDIGAGTGRDAAWFAARGHTVLAVEPTLEFRQAGMKLHPSPSIEWFDDALPELSVVTSRGQLFDTIVLNAVWMHLGPSERHRAMAKLATLMARNGILMLSLRHGPIPDGRRMFNVAAEETIALAGRYGLLPVLNVETMSVQEGNRAADVKWTRLVFTR
jgi:SAM-dependent methyltransferase